MNKASSAEAGGVVFEKAGTDNSRRAGSEEAKPARDPVAILLELGSIEIETPP